MIYPDIRFRRNRKGIYGPGNDLVKYDWYVNGNLSESGNGRSLNGGFLTIAEAMAAAGPGATIWIERLYDGTPYRETLTAPGSNSGLYSSGVYDEKTKTWSKGAIISGADIIDNSLFTQAAAPNTNVYTIAVTVETGATQFVNYFEDDAYLSRVTDIATCQATPGSYYVSGESGAITVGFHPSDSSDPITNGKVYEYTKRIHAIYADLVYSNVTVDGLRGDKALSDSGCISIKAYNSRVTNFMAYKGGNHTFQIDPRGSLVSAGVMEGGYSGTRAGTLFNYNANSFNGENFSMSNVKIWHTLFTEPGAALCLPMNGHQNASGYLGTVTLNGITVQNFSNSGNSFAFNHSGQIVVTNLSLVDAFGITGPSASVCDVGCTFTIDGLTITNNQAGLRGIDWSSAGLVPLVITNMTLTMNALPNTGCVFVGGNNTVSVTYSDIVSNLTTGSRIAVYAQNCASANLTFSNNTYNKGSGSWTYHYAFLASASGMTWSSDYNAFEATNDAWNIFGTIYSDLASYQTATSQDAHSTST